MQKGWWGRRVGREVHGMGTDQTGASINGDECLLSGCSVIGQDIADPEDNLVRSSRLPDQLRHGANSMSIGGVITPKPAAWLFTTKETVTVFALGGVVTVTNS